MSLKRLQRTAHVCLLVNNINTGQAPVRHTRQIHNKALVNLKEARIVGWVILARLERQGGFH
jgi:hypothetical protein